ncbi:LysR family transcriptional regulator [Spirillospora sp. NPDC047279]|uniref:LysR family transcriptional regulator n=1 Tax=Spirillospora sp. NPDC047279 TaxID=3155478 RepID=UPI0033F53B49
MLDLRELEAFLVLSEELHFGRTAERLYVSQGRISQLVRSLERRTGARLFDRTSRRVRLTPLGERLLADLRPAYDALHSAVASAQSAARGVEGTLRVGFLPGSTHERVVGRIAAFQDEHPASEVLLSEIPLSDPFAALRRGDLDAAIVLDPVDEPGLVTGPPFSKEPQTLVVSTRHPFAGRTAVPAEDLAGCALLDLRAPAEWKAPSATPSGRPIPRGPQAGTLQEALALIAADRGAMLFCAPTVRNQARTDVTSVPVTGLPDSAMTVVWRRGDETALLRAFTEAIS